MRTSEFDSSDEDDFGEEEATPLQISWLSLSVVECSQSLGICSLPGCRYKDIRRNLQKDVAEFCDQGVEDVFVFCTRGELMRYRVPCLLEAYSQRGLRVHHLPFPDGGAPELSQCGCILEELQGCLQNQRRTVIHCYGGLGRSGLSKYQTLGQSVMCIGNVKSVLCVVLECNLCLIVIVAACLLLQLSVSMTPSKALEILRELRGGGAIQTVKQYNFLHEFREKFEAYQAAKEALSERSVSR
ncbi:cyclin-dependent kinase inhibitor 3 isoform X1 [Triplophysa rosa]|uniref:cyclin-dependent kinase inhibitor 3 isoform X1 n=1 Tax=Triplophysa rosa TaxID=992332 RepID=UPI002545F62D|nr:cyclin-dependent kinase inhibitor 3 isoform X1 [Triplophysa rosa]XP_057198682.1 cyclin-dependent kinase inhibitor 3 isoform X1 [Triplophysa rosa]XP_057198684.1 cyclin-dependent kinase inhibitor 3 isoform X1 [Triplophysa rosa]